MRISDWSSDVCSSDLNDGKAVEHGFVSFWPAADNTLGLAWLDGRNPAGGGHAGHAGAGGAGMPSLRAATINVASQVADAVEVDATVCDCCGTAGRQRVVSGKGVSVRCTLGCRHIIHIKKN